ncbi:hypothetical protein DUI87_04588 [Hirundo rustica rustica]|uniref:Uncharacterized protein n=1 Tax=Hirundo rustica rustica TaxID=333673 RepID=A0A3M0KZG4_HIRRU|nr:hypothetical protein DUI87_04588 [Hirundo rustica rustica]
MPEQLHRPLLGTEKMGMESSQFEQRKNIAASSFEMVTYYIELQYKIRSPTSGTIFAKYKTNLLRPIDGSKWDSQKMLYKGQTKCQNI